MAMGKLKKPALMASEDFTREFSHVSKQALIDILWCACQLGTNETPREIEAQAARSACIVLQERGDRILPALKEWAERNIDSD